MEALGLSPDHTKYLNVKQGLATSTLKETKTMKFDQCKVDIQNQSDVNKVLEELYSIGYQWSGPNPPTAEDIGHLYMAKGYLSFSKESVSFFNLHEHKEITVQDILQSYHPHHEHMKSFAEDAATTSTPWIHYQFKHPHQTNWTDCLSIPRWSTDLEYRRKPLTRTIHGVEIPILTFVPDYGDDILMVGVHSSNGYYETTWIGSDHEVTLLDAGLIYPATDEGARACKLHAEALIVLSLATINKES